MKIKLFFALLMTMKFQAQFINIDDAVKFTCDSILNLIPDYSDYFATNLLNTENQNQFNNNITEVVGATGVCTSYNTDNNHNYFFYGSHNSSVNISIQINSGLFSQFSINSVSIPSTVVTISNSISSDLEVNINFDFDIGIYITNMASTSTAQFNSLNLMPLSSGYRIFILNSLEEQIQNGDLSWTDTFPIRNEYKSIGFGTMNTLPAGQMVSLQDFASNLVKFNDNTAADHLINILTSGLNGANITAGYNGEYLNYFNASYPFLTTAEFYKLKWGSSQATQLEYINGSVSDQLNILSTIIDPKNVTLIESIVSSVQNDITSPVDVYSIGWFATPVNVCNTTLNIKNYSDIYLDNLLGYNSPYINYTDSNSNWLYSGFIGDSNQSFEPGVYSFTYLLMTPMYNWGCLTLEVASSSSPINRYVVNDLVQKLIITANQVIGAAFISLNSLVLLCIVILFLFNM